MQPICIIVGGHLVPGLPVGGEIAQHIVHVGGFPTTPVQQGYPQVVEPAGVIIREVTVDKRIEGTL